ncbi:MAG: hypothetical protein H8E83_03975 [Planctomycetes bacterium]|nr:hypothetical protein [Planctomycetota bacterium]
MTHDSRKEKIEAALSGKRHQVAERTSRTTSQVLRTVIYCCLRGNWSAATTNFTTAMNMILTGIVNPKAGANRKP